MAAPDKIYELISTFERNSETYKSQSYNETQARREFIDPFFKALGWDIDNSSGKAEAYKDVIHEDAIKIGGTTKAPDYCFRIGGTRKFFVEAKKPHVNIKDDPMAAYQLRRYGWNQKLPLSILTDFDEFAVYDCRIKPNLNDKASVARVMFLTYKDYIEKWDTLVSIFSKEGIEKGSFDKFVTSTKDKKGTQEVDDAFLKEIESWREMLARNIALRNPELSNRALNDVVQKTIDRIVFLRICEDRAIEPPNQLQSLLNGANIYARLIRHYLDADSKYNSGLFHFQSEKGRENYDQISLEINIDDKPLKEIIKRLYYPESPYEFSVIPIEILGQVYERFLGKVIRLTPGHQAKVEEKPEVRKAGGVYYTPKYIVDYIVENTVGKILEGKSPEDAKKIKILDPACGSGSFLIGAYKYLLDWYISKYSENSKKYLKMKNQPIFQAMNNEFKLTIKEKKDILLSHIYGVDIDSQAVEVTKLSLLLKVLEGETEETITNQFRMFHERALPDLDGNIKCGNSLIGSDFYNDKDLSLFPQEEMEKINCFDWEREFPEIFREKKLSEFHHITFETKYSRMQKEHILKGYTGEFVKLSDEERLEFLKILIDIRNEMGFKILALSVLPDHVHLVIATMDNTIEKIVKKIKGVSAHDINRRFKSSVKGEGYQESLWAKGYYDKTLNSVEHIRNAIEYVQNNYNKHKEKWGDFKKSELNQFKSLVNDEAIINLTTLKDFEYGGGFDVVIGNPPYVNIINVGSIQRDYYEKHYKISIDLFTLFIEKSLRILNKEGLFSFIIPSLFIKGVQFESLRKFFNEEANFYYLKEFGDNVFQNVKMPTCVFTINQRLKKEIYDFFKHDELKYFNKKNITLLENLCLIRRGLEIGRDKLKISDDICCITGGDIDRYLIKSYHFIDEVTFDEFKKENDIFNNEKILIRETGNRLYCSFDNKGYLTTRSIYNVKSTKEYDIKYILGIINSKLFLFYFNCFISPDTNIFPKIRIIQVKQIPIRTIDFSNKTEKAQHDRLVSLVSQMLEAQKQYHSGKMKTESDKKLMKQRIDIIDKQIDALVYELYGLTEEEIKVVEGSV